MDIREEYFEKTKAELEKVAAAGVLMCGNAFSQVLLIKGEPEASDSPLLEGEDGKALRAALKALGYAPEDWAGIAAYNASGSALTPEAARLAIATFDPNTIIALDEPAAALLRETFVDELMALPNLEQATLQPGYVVPILGMRVLVLGGFEQSLNDAKAKQLMWARLKQIPPLGEPY